MTEHIVKRKTQWEARSMEQTERGWKDVRTGFIPETGEEVREERPVASYNGPPFHYVGRAAGDDARWEQVVARKEELGRSREEQELPDLSTQLHDYAEQVCREAVGRRVFSVPDLPWKREKRP